MVEKDVEEEASVQWWQVLDEEGQVVRSAPDAAAEALGHKAQDAVVRGRLLPGGWLALDGEPGFLPSEDDVGPTLKRLEHAPEADTAVAEGGEEQAPAEEPAAEEEDEEAVRDAAWQAAVSAMACLPGAGTVLWCPACPLEASWTGGATKAPALLRHLASEAAKGCRKHRRLLDLLLALLSAQPPPRAEDGEGALQEWAMGSKLLEVTGPLLAKPGPEARKAVRKLEDRTLGPDPLGAHDDEEPQQVIERKAKKAKTAPEGPGYSFYNDDIPMDVFAECQDQTKRTADGVPIMDLLDSDEEPAPCEPAPCKPAPCKPCEPVTDGDLILL